MAITFNSKEIEQLDTTTAVIYTCPEGTTSQVVFANATNKDTSNNATFTITVTPSGGSAATYVPGRTIPAGKSDQPPEIIGMILDTGDAISAFAGSASDINLKLGIKETV